MPFSCLKFISIMVILLGLSACNDIPDMNINKQVYAKLETILDERRNSITSLLNNLESKIQQSKTDATLLHFFSLFRPSHNNTNVQNINFSEQTLTLDKHYVQNYEKFYDILFIDETGLIFHTVKMENDYHKNLFGEAMAQSTLSQALKQNPDTHFVDYHFYNPSQEAAAFFVIRVKAGGENIGWIAFQFSVNAFNSILDQVEGLGRTGEVYLTNAKKMMLTQSRLLAENTTLNRKVDTGIISTAAKQESGHMIIQDYRGAWVYSTFEKIQFSGTTWIIIAEIDEDEIITNHLNENLDYYMDLIESKLERDLSLISPPVISGHAGIKVDINEFARAAPEEKLVTYGIATCTGIIVHHLGQYSYLGHIFPLDTAYHSKWDNWFLNIGMLLQGRSQEANSQDLLGDMIHKIKNFDTIPSKLNELDVTLVAVQNSGFRHMVGKLLAEGFFASQIKILYNSKAAYANLFVSANENIDVIEWNLPNSTQWSNNKAAESLESLVKKLSGQF